MLLNHSLRQPKPGKKTVHKKKIASIPYAHSGENSEQNLGTKFYSYVKEYYIMKIWILFHNCKDILTLVN